MVVLLVTLPSLLLPASNEDGTQIVALVAIFAALFTIVEYTAKSPSLVEFRDAPPFNRMRFCALFATVFSLSVIFRGYTEPTTLTAFFQNAGDQIGRTIDFPYSPVRLMVAMMPPETPDRVIIMIRDAAGLSYLIALLSVIWFIVLLRLQHWPRRGGAFNVWVNLPTFDPTSGGDVVRRLSRDAQINIVLGVILPFFVPAVVKISANLGAPIDLTNPQTLIWAVTAWAFLPASIIMRGVALSRVGQMIELQRKKAYEKAEANGMLPA